MSQSKSSNNVLQVIVSVTDLPVPVVTGSADQNEQAGVTGDGAVKAMYMLSGDEVTKRQVELRRVHDESAYKCHLV